MVGSDVPVFIPPRKRQTTKKTNGTQNYVDHIVSVKNHLNGTSKIRQIDNKNLIFIDSHQEVTDTT